jgi:hypothetical protein
MMVWVPAFPNAGWLTARVVRFVRRIKHKVQHVDSS